MSEQGRLFLLYLLIYLYGIAGYMAQGYLLLGWCVRIPNVTFKMGLVLMFCTPVPFRHPARV